METTKKARNSAGMMLFVCPKLEEGENWQDTIWIPVLARIIIMPNNIGPEKTDNGHAEAMGMALAEETLPTSLPYILLTNSNALKIAYRCTRDGVIPSPRFFVRNILSGTGKGSIGRILKNQAL